MLQKVFIMNISSKKKFYIELSTEGIKELDIIFEKFVNTYKYKLNDQEFKELEEILNLPDNLLLDIILKKEKVPANYDNPVMKKIFKTCNDKSSE